MCQHDEGEVPRLRDPVPSAGATSVGLDGWTVRRWHGTNTLLGERCGPPGGCSPRPGDPAELGIASAGGLPAGPTLVEAMHPRLDAAPGTVVLGHGYDNVGRPSRRA